MFIDDIPKLDYNDVLIVPNRSVLESRQQINLSREFQFLHSKNKWEGIPIIAANMDGVGTFAMGLALQEHKILTAITKHYKVSEWEVALDKGLDMKYNILSIGIRDEDLILLEQLQTLIQKKRQKLHFICVDVANGYTNRFTNYVQLLREQYPKITLIAGNVVTPDITTDLILKGVDIVKIGIGSGSACITRLKTGIGYPQFSAVVECAQAAHKVGGNIIADGGCNYPADVAKALAAGGDFVMLGGMFAGHDESSFIPKDGYIAFYGMSSQQAMETHYGEMSAYRTSEGREVKIKYKGAIENTLKDILGGIRSTCTYVGAVNIKNLPKCANFIKVYRTHNTIFENL